MYFYNITIVLNVLLLLLFAMVASFKFQCSRLCQQTSTLKLPAWLKATAEVLQGIMLSDLRSLLKCEMHSVADLNHFCEQLYNIIIVASRQCIPHTGYNPHTRPGWTKEIKQLHSTKRNFRRMALSLTPIATINALKDALEMLSLNNTKITCAKYIKF